MNNKLTEDQQYELNEKLFEACRDNDLSQVKRLIKKGADIHYLQEEEAHSLLSIAASYNHSNIVSFLLKNGVKVDEHDDIALDQASHFDALDSIQILIAHGGKVTPKLFVNAYASGNVENSIYFIENFDIKIPKDILEHINIHDDYMFTYINKTQLERAINKNLGDAEKTDKKRPKI